MDNEATLQAFHDGWNRKKIGSLCKVMTKTLLLRKAFRPNTSCSCRCDWTGKNIGSRGKAVTRFVLLGEALDSLRKV